MTETDDKYVLIWQLIIVRKSAAQIHTKAQKFCLTFFVGCEVYWFLMNHCQNRSWKTLLRELRTRRSCWWNFDAQSESLGPRWKKLCSERKRSSRSRAEQRYWLSCLLLRLLFATKSSAYRSQNSCSSLMLHRLLWSGPFFPSMWTVVVEKFGPSSLDFVTALVRVPDVKVVAKRRDKCPVNCKVGSCFYTSS